MSPAERASYEADMVAAGLAAVKRGLDEALTHLRNARAPEGAALRDELGRLWESFRARAEAAEKAAVAAEAAAEEAAQ